MENLITQAAKELRKRQTEAEKLLWARLRNKHLQGIKFRRQEPLGSYIVDFVSIENKLIIEIDGQQHKEIENKQNDIQRTLYLEGRGYKVIRFWNGEVLNNFESVIGKILNALDSCPHPDPLP